MAQSKFKSGDVVELLSGSPKMTVWMVGVEDFVYCYVYDTQRNAIRQEEKLPSAVLKLVEGE